ncbi:MAG: UDP-2,3-diacylglucosamine pyrophosphatase LpxH [Bradymonadia bacterium]|jgi:UDP-2,3-diacylglucosamine pyrophosphatase LpxH
MSLRPLTIPRVHADGVAIFGDLHLAAPGTEACGRANVETLQRLLDALRRRADLIIVNGDLFDLERGRLPWSQNRELSRLKAAHAELLRLLRAPDIIWVAGNHDAVLGDTGEAALAIDVVLPTAVLRVEHGHRFDAPIKRLRAFASGVTWLSGRVRRPPWTPVFRAMKLAERVLAGDTEEHCPVEAGAAASLRRDGSVDAMVIGHTHRALERRVGEKLLLNPGGSEDRLRALVVRSNAAGTGVHVEHVDIW